MIFNFIKYSRRQKKAPLQPLTHGYGAGCLSQTASGEAASRQFSSSFQDKMLTSFIPKKLLKIHVIL